MKAISHFIRQFRCQLHQPGASAAAHTSPPKGLAQPFLGPRCSRRAHGGGRGLGLLLLGHLALHMEHRSTGWLCSQPAQPGSVGNSVPKATRAGRALQPRTATLLLLRSWAAPPAPLSDLFPPPFLHPVVRGWLWYWQLGLGLSWQLLFLTPPCPQHSRWAHGHLGTSSCHPGMCFVSPGSSSRAEPSRSRPVPGWHPRPGDTAVRCHTPRVDNIQMPARPGYESARTGENPARTGAQQPLWDKRSCPGGAGAKFPAGWRADHGQQRLRCHLQSNPGHGKPLPGIHSPACTALFPRCQAMARWHRARAVPNLDPPSRAAAGRARLSPGAPGHRHVPPGRPEHSSGESLSLTGYLKAHSCPLSPLMFRLEEPRGLP